MLSGAMLVILALFLAGCGGGSFGAPTSAALVTDGTPPQSATEAADAALLDKVLGRQEPAIVAYGQVLPKLPRRLAHLAARSH